MTIRERRTRTEGALLTDAPYGTEALWIRARARLTARALERAIARAESAFKTYRREMHRPQEFPRERMEAAAALYEARALRVRIGKRLAREYRRAADRS